MNMEENYFSLPYEFTKYQDYKSQNEIDKLPNIKLNGLEKKNDFYIVLTTLAFISSFLVSFFYSFNLGIVLIFLSFVALSSELDRRNKINKRNNNIIQDNEFVKIERTKLINELKEIELNIKKDKIFKSNKIYSCFANYDKSIDFQCNNLLIEYFQDNVDNFNSYILFKTEMETHFKKDLISFCRLDEFLGSSLLIADFCLVSKNYVIIIDTNLREYEFDYFRDINGKDFTRLEFLNSKNFSLISLSKKEVRNNPLKSINYIKNFIDKIENKGF